MEAVTMNGRAGSRATYTDFSKLPGYRDAREIPTVRATELDEPRFFRDHVNRLLPCRVVGAVDHWPAAALWKSQPYLLGKIGAEREVRARTHPLAEFGGLTPIRAVLHEQNARTHEAMPFSEFLERASAPSCGHLVLHAYPLVPRVLPSDERYPLALRDPFISSFAPLAPDVSGFRFLKTARRGRLYGPYRIFLFRNSFTDWHYHTTDETLMCQVHGAKEVMLLPPDQHSWDLLMPVMREFGRTFDHDLAARFAGARLHRTVVEPGDALYIPPYWWHSVASLEDRMGITVASCFRSPFATVNDLRYPAARDTLRGSLAASLRNWLPRWARGGGASPNVRTRPEPGRRDAARGEPIERAQGASTLDRSS